MIHQHRPVCPGSFDPVTLGHLDIVERASKIYDEVTVAVLVNKKKSSLYTVEAHVRYLDQVPPGARLEVRTSVRARRAASRGPTGC